MGEYVYFIQRVDSGLIKIGITGNVRRRFKQLQGHGFGNLIVLGFCPGKTGYERKLHREFAEFRKTGEWFVPSTAILEFIQTHTEPMIDPLRPETKRKPKSLDERKSQPRLPSVVVTRDFLRDIHAYCAENNIEMSELIRGMLADRIYGKKRQV
jgi:hypothetical protein